MCVCHTRRRHGSRRSSTPTKHFYPPKSGQPLCRHFWVTLPVVTTSTPTPQVPPTTELTLPQTLPFPVPVSGRLSSPSRRDGLGCRTLSGVPSVFGPDSHRRYVVSSPYSCLSSLSLPNPGPRGLLILRGIHPRRNSPSSDSKVTETSSPSS